MCEFIWALSTDFIETKFTDVLHNLNYDQLSDGNLLSHHSLEEHNIRLTSYVNLLPILLNLNSQMYCKIWTMMNCVMKSPLSSPTLQILCMCECEGDAMFEFIHSILTHQLQWFNYDELCVVILFYLQPLVKRIVWVKIYMWCCDWFYCVEILRPHAQIELWGCAWWKSPLSSLTRRT